MIFDRKFPARHFRDIYNVLYRVIRQMLEIVADLIT